MAQENPIVHHGAYTIGIISALGLETNAVRLGLDREHRRLPVNSHDPTLYVLGELSGHNVVVACLPGSQGKSASAIAATHMARTFPSIKYRILVGTGGGAPSVTNDIRLGDVVVSMPTALHGGVVQYDLGKDTETAFVRKGVSSPAPSVLRAAVYKMQVDQDYRINWKRGVPEPTPYADLRPSEPDLLFEATYPHQLSQSSCEGCDAERTVQRPIRIDDTPRTFYGLIASGDRLVRSGIKRDAIIRDIDDDALCFEMEAAGFMHEFPAVVIRGISNYADSHKNDAWRNYAAASAAACARELLSHLEPERLCHYRAPAASTEILDQFLADICEADPQNEMTRIQQSKGGLVAECISWIIESPQLQTWRTGNEARLLWMNGSPGMGKTMAMIGLVERHTGQIASRDSLCYFFCQNNKPHLNNAVSVLRALISKLLWKNRELCRYIPDVYKWKKDHGREVFDSPNAFAMLTTMLSEILRDGALGRVCFVIDALDECDDGMESLLEWILRETSDCSSKAKWLISSRPSPRIEQLLRLGDFNVYLSLDSCNDHILKSVNCFIKHRMDRFAIRKALSPAERDEIERMLKQSSGPTFLWVSFVFQRLQETSRRKAKGELEKFPSGLGPVYDRMLDQLEGLNDEDDKQLCKKMIRLVMVAPRPLNLEELGTVSGLPVDSVDDLLELVELCSSFLVLRGGYVCLIHPSVKDYFADGRSRRLFTDEFANEHEAIIQRLLDVMGSQSTQDTDSGGSQDSLILPSTQVNPLALLGSDSTRWVVH